MVKVPSSSIVYTPRPLAAAIVMALGDTETDSWLEPCVGGGVFIESLASIGVPRSRIRALDLDPKRQPPDGYARTLRGQEFLKWSAGTIERFSRIVANPPYVALSRVPRQIQSAALAIEVPRGGRVPLRANCWFAFLCASIALLEEGGSLAFLLPAAWEYSDYAAPLRKSLPTRFREIDIHRSARPLFTAVQEGCVVLLARDYRGEGGRSKAAPRVTHARHARPEDLIEALKRTATPKKPAGWEETPSAPRVCRESTKESVHGESVSRTPVLNDVMQIRLGGVTGDAGYFLLSDERRKENKLPVEACRPVVSRAHHLAGGALTKAGWEALRRSGERIWLFDPPSAAARNSNVRAYLKLTKSNGGCNRQAFKVKSRQPWYRTPLSPQVDGFMSGMSSWGPWVVFREMSGLAATNTLYVVRFLTAKTRDEQAAIAMWLLTSRAQLMLRPRGRRYADGLLKFEPNDVGTLPMQSALKTKGAYAAYKRAVRLLLLGRGGESAQIANQWFAAGASSRKKAHKRRLVAEELRRSDAE